MRAVMWGVCFQNNTSFLESDWPIADSFGCRGGSLPYCPLKLRCTFNMTDPVCISHSKHEAIDKNKRLEFTVITFHKKCIKIKNVLVKKYLRYSF